MADADNEPTPANPNSARSKDKPEEFGRFEALTRKLLRVSKSELDEKRNGAKTPAPSTPRK